MAGKSDAEPTRKDVTVNQGTDKGMPMTSVDGAKTGVSPSRTKVAGARAPQRTPSSVPVHQLRDNA